MTKKLLMGNEAMAHAALEAGVGVVAGYPGTPSSEIVETVARQHRRGAAHGVHVEWSTNEKAALELLFGASLAGARGLFTCKQMGLNVASDALMSLNYVSVRGGLVLIVADDPGPISSQTEQDTRRFAMFAKVPVLDPSTPEQAFDMVKAAFDLSERFQTPVIVRPTTRVDHASAFFDVQEETHALPILENGFQRDPSKWVIFPKRAHEAHGEIIQRLNAIGECFSQEPPYSAFNVMEEAGESFTGEPTFGILTSGITASYVREALRMIRERAQTANISLPRYRLMQVGTPYPFPDNAIGAFTNGLAEVLVLEELDHVLEDELAMFAGRTRGSFRIKGKLTGDARDTGENDVDDILMRIERFLGLTGRLSLYRFKGGSNQDSSVHLSSRAEADLPSRPPVLCAGCPHRGSFYAVKQALGIQPAVMCGDIGCYTLGNAQPLDAIDTCLCMGAGVTMAQGISVANPDRKAIAYIGDSTLFASGETGLSNAAYNGHDITVMVLDNTTTAMTGFQPHPGTGRTLMGRDNRALSIDSVLKANGFTEVYHANPFDRDAAVSAATSAIGYKGPSAVVFEGACAQLVEPLPPVIINTEICTGCKRCITAIGCPAISYNPSLNGPRSRDRGQAIIDTALCTGCGLCTQVCPFHAIHADSAVYRSSGQSIPVSPIDPLPRTMDARPGLEPEEPEESTAPTAADEDVLEAMDSLEEDAAEEEQKLGAHGMVPGASAPKHAAPSKDSFKEAFPEDDALASSVDQIEEPPAVETEPTYEDFGSDAHPGILFGAPPMEVREEAEAVVEIQDQTVAEEPAIADEEEPAVEEVEAVEPKTASRTIEGFEGSSYSVTIEPLEDSPRNGLDGNGGQR